MRLKTLSNLFSFRDVRNAVLGISVVIGGLGLSFLTIFAHQSGNSRLAGIAAGASLVFVLLILIFVVPPLARSASQEASQMNLPFEFTVGGAVILGLIAIVGFAAWNTGNNLLFLVLSFLAAALVIGFFVGNFCLNKLDVKMRFPEAIHAGEPTPILVSLHNRKRVFPTFSVVAEVRGREREASQLFDEIKNILPEKWARKFSQPPLLKHTLDYFVHIPRRRSIENLAEHIFPRRGRFIIKDFELSTKFPFAFFRHRRRLSAQAAEIIIFPRLLPVTDEAADLPQTIGRFVTPKKGLGQDLLALRDYQPMDDFRRVDWKATARTNRLIVREFSAEDERRITVVFDARFAEIDAAEKNLTLRQRLEAEQSGKTALLVSPRFEIGVSRAASLLAHFDEERAETRLIVNDEIGEFGIGREHLKENLKRLAILEMNYDRAADFPAETVEEILSKRENSYTFLITAQKEFSDELRQAAKIVRY